MSGTKNGGGVFLAEAIPSRQGENPEVRKGWGNTMQPTRGTSGGPLWPANGYDMAPDSGPITHAQGLSQELGLTGGLGAAWRQLSEKS